MVERKMPKAVPLSKFTESSRPPGMILCYQGSFREGIYKTWKDFLEDTAKLRRGIGKRGGLRWILHCEDYWHFLTAYTALLQCKKHILLIPVLSEAYIAELRTGDAVLLTDRVTEDALYLPALLEGPIPEKEEGTLPRIDPEEGTIILYTSGTTGEPKAVRQRLKEFETDNAFILSKWGEEFLKRKLCSTVSPHHIYGLLFSIMLPFTVGVPFRRRRIEYPEEFETLSDEAYLIVTAPAFLKRGAAMETFPLRDPWIFSSGGVLLPETARKTEAAFGFWPLELYGSTETSGIAYRQSKNGLEWTLFDNASISKNGEGCLAIRSPYIRDPGGFTTGDLVEILPGGRFLLKGRADSIVKIEEKRVSLPEVENRLLQSGLVADAAVIPLAGKRQYLAAAVVLNGAGKERFRDTEKRLVNRYFREYLAGYVEAVVTPKKWRFPGKLPPATQRTKKLKEIRALFGPEGPSAGEQGLGEEKLLERTGDRAALEFLIPGESDYFDGHFPGSPVLPAAAQIDLTLRFAARYLGSSRSVVSSGRTKFPAPCRPGTPVRLELELNRGDNTLRFKMTDPGGGTVYSIGTLFLDGAP